MSLDNTLREIFTDPEWGQYRNNWQFELQQIKAAFAEAGYVQIPQVEVVTRYERGKKPEVFMVNGKEVMTGAEFYDRYVEALTGKQVEVKLIDDNEVLSTMTLCDKAARKAAGL